MPLASRIVLILCVLVGLVALAVPVVGVASAPRASTPRLGKVLSSVQRATARYRDERVALRAGYRPLGECVAAPGQGAMGIHYVNQALLADPAINPKRPEILLYLPVRGGGRRLVGVEYMRVDADQDLTTANDRPSVVGQPFDGPMEGHEPGMPRHYDKHIWVWRQNPGGVYSLFNRMLRC
jgi:hypothetical protein